MAWGNFKTAFVETAEETCVRITVKKNDKET